nr:MAG TPA_asm: hypothetical protein [Caudoviricetes sp.]
MGFKHAAEALGCRLRFRQFLQGLMGCAPPKSFLSS